MISTPARRPESTRRATLSIIPDARADSASSGNALSALEAVEPPAETNRFAPQRLLRLAVAASNRAALSSRGEVYPKGMAATQALRQSLGALLGPRRLSVEDIGARVEGRYPACEPLPRRPALDQLLASAGAQLSWHDGPTAEESGYYPPSVNVASVAVERHYGDEFLGAWILRYRPMAVLCGHVHQSPFASAGSWSDQLGPTVVFNAGRQRGPVPTHIELDTDTGRATWRSLAGTEERTFANA